MKKKYKLITVAASIGIVTASIAAPTYLIISNETTKKNSNESNNPLIPEENETPADTEYPYSYFFEWNENISATMEDTTWKDVISVLKQNVAEIK